MSKIALSPHASGTGVFTIQSPNSNTDRTLTLPDEAGTVLTSASSVKQNSGPAFSVRLSAIYSGWSTGTWNKMPFAVEDFDTDSCFDSTTNYRFTPNVAGYYFINFQWGSGSGQVQTMEAAIYKNGSKYSQGGIYMVAGNTLDDFRAFCSSLIYMNGSTDYLEFYFLQNGGNTNVSSSEFDTRATGFLART